MALAASRTGRSERAGGNFRIVVPYVIIKGDGLLGAWREGARGGVTLNILFGGAIF